ncbi:MAG: type II secretion system F family protein [Bacillota bacterium]|nr:type II secretion system F family protein [Bacillota bacterium]
MSINKLLPDPEIAMSMYDKLYNSEHAKQEIEQNIKRITRIYLLIGALFVVSVSATLFQTVAGEGSGFDLAGILILFATLLFIVYRNRYGWVEKQIKTTKESIIEDFPEFTDKLILLLNAGMVTEAALRKIAFDYKKSRELIGKRALYEGLSNLIDRAQQTNSGLKRELSEYAVKSGVRELLRFSAIVEDNINKGSSLAEKLEAEGTLLWMDRKKRAEERARLAETKLSFPLMLLLLSLVIITTAPILLSL